MDSWNKPPRKSPWDKRQPTPPNVDELLNNLQNRFRHRLPQGNAGLILIVVAAAVWLATGFFIVDPQEQAVVKRFGVGCRLSGLVHYIALAYREYRHREGHRSAPT